MDAKMNGHLILPRTLAGCLIALAAAVPPGLAAEEGIHIASDRSTSFMWTVTDSAGFRWDIAGNGVVSDGTNDAYDGGMQLQVNNETFPSYSNARLNKEGNEVEIGPWQNRGVDVYRRVHVSAKGGYCRWIDVFENSGAGDVTLSVRYYSNMGDGTGRLYTSSGAAEMAEKDWGVVTGGQSESSRPSIVHVFATGDAKVRPRFQYTRGNDELYYNVQISVPAKKAVALCFFQAQRTPFDAASKFLKDFQVQRELQGLPLPLRRIILNMAGAGSTLGQVELKRSEEADTVILRTGDEILGQIQNPQFVLKTSFGEVKLPAKDVIGLQSVSAENSRVHMVLVGGQVVGGELSGDLAIKLAGGTELSIPPKGLIQAAYRITPERPAEIAVISSLVALRTGEQLAIDDASLTLEFLTAHGLLSLPVKDLQAVEMDTPAGGLHRVVFRNGSILAGLLTADRIPLRLRLGLPLDATPAQIRRFLFVNQAQENKSLAALTLRNNDVLYGRFADEKWVLTSKFGNVSVVCADVAEAEFPPESLGQARLTLRDGTKLGGQLATEYVNFKIEPGPTVKVFVGHMASVKGGPPGEKPPVATSGPATRPGEEAATRSTVGASGVGGPATRPSGETPAATDSGDAASPAPMPPTTVIRPRPPRRPVPMPLPVPVE